MELPAIQELLQLDGEIMIDTQRLATFRNILNNKKKDWSNCGSFKPKMSKTKKVNISIVLLLDEK